MPEMRIELNSYRIGDLLEQKGLHYLKVCIRGANIVIYSENNGIKENRIRFTYTKAGIYILGMADHNGKWEQTPFEGTAEELLDMVLNQFQWVLCNYDMDDSTGSKV